MRQKDRSVHTQGSPWRTRDMRLDSGLSWRHSWVLELDITHEILWFCLQPQVTERYSQCWQGEYSIVPSPALTSNLYWSCREFELLGECGRILSCNSRGVISGATQSVHTTAHNSISILSASMLDAIPCLWKCSRNSRTILYFTGQNVTAWKAGCIEALGRVISF